MTPAKQKKSHQEPTNPEFKSQNSLNEDLSLYNPGLGLQDIASFGTDERELRFTRNRQAFGWMTLACTFFTTALFTAFYITMVDDLYYTKVFYWYAALQLVVSGALFYYATYCLKHAYVILSPVGIDVLPIIYPSKRLKFIPWDSIYDISLSGAKTNLHLNSGKTVTIKSGMMNKQTRAYFVQAITHRVTLLLKRYGKAGKTPSA